MTKTKENVRLRTKTLRNGAQSLYLDIYENGCRRYEFLRLYLIPERNSGDKAINAETMKIARSVCAQRTIALNSGRLNVETNNGKRVRLFPYLEALGEGKRGAWSSMLVNLHRYEKRDITLGEVTPQWLEGYRVHLTKSELMPNTQWLYWGYMKYAVRRAYNTGLIPDVLRNLGTIKQQRTERVFLTIDELRVLASTPCTNDTPRRMFLFSCLTGLRWSDCIALRWSEVEDSVDGCRIVFRQQKTGGLQYLDINPQAREYMGKRQEADDNIFRDCNSLWYTNRVLKRWIKQAGIYKHISFHCARHTFATMMLSIGTDIFVVSRLLGHTNIKTTQVYAHILDQQKREAISRIPQI